MTKPRDVNLSLLDYMKTIAVSEAFQVTKSEAILERVKSNRVSLTTGMAKNDLILGQLQAISVAQNKSLRNTAEVLNMLQKALARSPNRFNSCTPGPIRPTLQRRQGVSALDGGCAERFSMWDFEAPWLGIQYSLVQTGKHERKNISCSLISKITFVDYTIVVKLSYQTFPTCRQISVLRGSGVSFSRVVSIDSEVKVGCRSLPACPTQDGRELDWRQQADKPFAMGHPP